MGQFREQGRLPSSTVVNPKGGFESAKAMHLRSGKQVGSDLNPSKPRSNEEEELRIEEEEQRPLTAKVEPNVPQVPSDPNSSNSSNKGKNVSSSVSTNDFPANVPFPSRFKQTKKEEAEKDILETFRKALVASHTSPKYHTKEQADTKLWEAGPWPMTVQITKKHHANM
ncbi:hypothetical protein ACFX2H_034389 [Malus domestica]